MSNPETLQWHDHEGLIAQSAAGFDVIDCRKCGFKHAIPIPTQEALQDTYQHDYYSREKPLYIERYQQDLAWWNMVYTHRFKRLENLLPATRRRLLEIGSGPGYFLLNGQQRGWQVTGCEPSRQAAEFSQSLGLEIRNQFFEEKTSADFGQYDAINLALVLEHIPDPAGLLKLVHRHLDQDGVACIIVPNDFNPFQQVLHQRLDYPAWWVAPPHHINYFDFDSLSGLVRRCGFEVVHREATFPIDMFLLMGKNYIGQDEVGRDCHRMRMNFEMALADGGQEHLMAELYAAFAQMGIGREVVLYARKSGVSGART